MILNFGIGLNTPPVGAVQFVACAVGKITVWEAMRSIWPFYGAGLVVLGLVTYIPALSLWLPERVQIGDATWHRHRYRPQDRTQAQALRARGRGAARAGAGGRDRARPEAADRGPVDRDLRRQPHRHPRGDGDARGRRAGRAAPGRRRLRARHIRRSPSARSAAISATRISQAINVLEVRMGIEIESAGLAALRRNAAQEARDPGSLLRVRAAAGARRADRQGRLRLSPRDRRRRPTIPFYVEMLDALGDRTIPCDITSPWDRPKSCRVEYQKGLQREHLVILNAISASDPQAARDAMRAHLIASQERYRKRLTRPAGRISCRHRQGRPDQPMTREPAGAMIRPYRLHVRATPSTRTPRRPWATDELRSHFHIGGPVPAGRISLTYTHYDRMIVGGAVPAGEALAARSDQADGHQEFPRPPRTDRRQYRRRRNGAGRRRDLRLAAARHDLCRHGHADVSLLVGQTRLRRRNSICSARRRIRPIRPSSSASPTPSGSISAARRPRTSARSSSSSMPTA